MVVYSFIFFLLIFVLIGVSSSFKSKSSNEDYLLAGGNVSPWLAGLSAVATNNSGYMFIGMIGYTYSSGVQSIWVLLAWLAGDFFVSKFTHKKLNKLSTQRSILSYGGLVAHREKSDQKILRTIVGIITIIFLGTYAAAQLKAGSKALHVLFDWDYELGSIIGAVIVFLYCYAGGIRASIWTDAAQSVTMFFSMALLCFYGISETGGFLEFINSLQGVSPTFLNFFPDKVLFDNSVGMFLFALGWFFGGVGVVGQPHIMVRFMTVTGEENVQKTKNYYYFWYFFFCLLTFAVGLTARIIFPDVSAFDAELALPKMGQALLPDILVGVILAGIFSATMSTADSQILSCSAAFSKDIFGRKKEFSIYITKAVTAVVTLIALAIALYGSGNVFNLVMVSWSILAAAFTPLIFSTILNRELSQTAKLFILFTSVITTLLWRYIGLNSFVYEAAAGVLIGVVMIFIFSSRRN